MSCCICNQPVEREDAPALTYSAYGHARLLCDRCDACLAELTRSRDPERIRAAMEELSSRRLAMDERDRAASAALSRLVDSASERLHAIEEGSFDFAAEEAADLVVEDIPEELLETEEDRELERRAEERERSSDRVFSYIWAAVMIAAIGAMIYILFFR